MDRPTVGLDVDDVLAAFTRTALDKVFARTGRLFVLGDIHTWDPFDSLPKEICELKESIYSEMSAEGGCYSLPVEDGAKEGVALLREVADVIIITSPWKGSRTWAHERERWLVDHFDVDHGDIYQCRKKFRVHVDFHVDDKVKHIEDREKHHKNGKGILWATPMNRFAPPHLSRIGDWKELVRFVTGAR